MTEQCSCVFDGMAAVLSKQRKVRTRRLILTGNSTEHLYELESENIARLMRRLDKLVSKAVDRELFGLPLSRAAAWSSSESARRAPSSLAAGPRTHRPLSARPTPAGKPVGPRGLWPTCYARGTMICSVAIRNVRHRGIKRFFERGDARRLHPAHVARIGRILAALDREDALEVLSAATFRLHPLKGGRKGLWSVRVSGNWRIVFRLEDGQVFDVDLTDYH